MRACGDLWEEDWSYFTHSRMEVISRNHANLWGLLYTLTRIFVHFGDDIEFCSVIFVVLFNPLSNCTFHFLFVCRYFNVDRFKQPFSILIVAQAEEKNVKSLRVLWRSVQSVDDVPWPILFECKEVHCCVLSLDEGQGLLFAWTLTKPTWSTWYKCWCWSSGCGFGRWPDNGLVEIFGLVAVWEVVTRRDDLLGCSGMSHLTHSYRA